MAVNGLFIRTAKSIGTLQLDAVLRENHVSSVSKTMHPIEFGADFTDHVFIQPHKYIMEGVVSDTPMGFAALGQIATNTLAQTLSPIASALGIDLSAVSTRSQEAFAELIKLQQLREPIEVQTKLVLLQSMIIDELVVTQDKDTSRALFFKATMSQVFVVDTSPVVTSDNLEPGDIAAQGASVISRGLKQAKELAVGSVTAMKSTIGAWVELELNDAV